MLYQKQSIEQNKLFPRVSKPIRAHEMQEMNLRMPRKELPFGDAITRFINERVINDKMACVLTFNALSQTMVNCVSTEPIAKNM